MSGVVAVAPRRTVLPRRTRATVVFSVGYWIDERRFSVAGFNFHTWKAKKPSLVNIQFNYLNSSSSSMRNPFPKTGNWLDVKDGYSPSHNSKGRSRNSSCLWQPSIFIEQRLGYMRRSLAQTILPSPEAFSQSNLHVHLGKLSGPNSQEAS